MSEAPRTNPIRTALSGGRRRATMLVRSAVCGVVLLIVAGCSEPGTGPRADSGSRQTPGAMGAAGSSPIAEDALLEARTVRSEAWTFDEATGTVLTTPTHRIYTTIGDERMLSRLPVFLSRALDHYTSALVELPRPQAPMDTYVMGTRPQWERLTQRFMGQDARPYLQIERGGFSARGTAILWDIGRRDTLAIAAHEGWHQYTQSVFRDSLPISLEEGVACYMEGFRWRDAQPNGPSFKPWSNFERFYQLRDAARGQRLMGIEELLLSSPQMLMQQGTADALDYYAQVWALTMFLVEGEGGKHRDALVRMIQDAQRGTLRAKIASALGERAASIHATRRRGIDVLSVYTGVPSADLEPAYKAFIADITRVGAGELIWRGQSPVSSGSSSRAPTVEGPSR